jgi:4-hydroxybenzoate polyprenyltransferase
MSGLEKYGVRARRAIGLLRFPWPEPHASLFRLVFLCLGASLAAIPDGSALSRAEILWRAFAIQACTISGFFGTVLLNDIADRDLDRVAHPERPLARGEVPLGDAVMLCAALYAITLVAALFLGWLVVGLVVFWLSIPVAAHYFIVKRGRGGRLSRSYSDLITPLQFAGLGVLVYLGFENDDFWAMFFLAGLIYCGDASMNVLQGIGDERADAAFRISTVATVHGRTVAARTALILHIGVLVNAAAYACCSRVPSAWIAGVAVLWALVARVVWGVVRAPEPPRLPRAIAATALALQLVLIGLGAVRLPGI